MTDFDLPQSALIARGALRLIRKQGSQVVFHDSDNRMSIDVREDEAIELANLVSASLLGAVSH